MCENPVGATRRFQRSDLLRRGPRAAVSIVSLLLLAVPLQAGEANAGTSDLEGSSSSQSGGCVESDTVLCLHEGRYEVTVEFTVNDETKPAKVARPRTDDSGLFYFFEPNNWEMLLKVLEACKENGHHWVYAATASDVGIGLVVRDTTLPAQNADGGMVVNRKVYDFPPLADRRRPRRPDESAEDYRRDVLAKGHPALTDAGAFPDACES